MTGLSIKISKLFFYLIRSFYISEVKQIGNHYENYANNRLLLRNEHNGIFLWKITYLDCLED